MSDLIIKGAKGIPDGLYVIKDGEFFKYKEKGGTVRSYHVTDRPRGEWVDTEFEKLKKCSRCGTEWGIYSIEEFDFCPSCGADMRDNND